MTMGRPAFLVRIEDISPQAFLPNGTVWRWKGGSSSGLESPSYG